MQDQPHSGPRTVQVEIYADVICPWCYIGKRRLDLAFAERPELAEAADAHDHGTRIAIVGRPNVGKSTLVNALIGEERVIAFDMPGTTREP